MLQKSAHSPSEIMEISNGYRGSAVLFAGYRLGIFNCLARKAHTSSEVARELKLDARGADIILHALAALGLLRKKGSKFEDSPAAGMYLAKESENCIGALVEHNMNAWDRWNRLDSVVKRGEPLEGRAQDHYLRKSRKKSREFILAMEAASLDTASELSKMLDLSHVKRMLDIGGGPGTHTFEIIRRKPAIQGVILDLPMPLLTTSKLVKKYRMSKQVTLVEGDFLADDYGTDFDLVLMSNVLHSNSFIECEGMIKKACDALNKKGQIIVKEYVLDENGTSPFQSALFSVNMLLNTRGGTSYKRSEIEGWMRRAGFKRIVTKPLKKYLIIFGTK